ncbi:hypothetical protein SmJEL517_g01731 [Synchytrium microbalum]|uniref:Mitochondrial carrier protein n=1 Tax=Synchytrium microbalum TaxID=1806994 RepID=A0A507C4G0_9FUNG|nr:uncharacterized protein SmJEL517_g01731 [Synchytrium microbalum]TPX35857.1 hypothetical protein SmJEL517_g01731 [Synchytrium microbalum]
MSTIDSTIGSMLSESTPSMHGIEPSAPNAYQKMMSACAGAVLTSLIVTPFDVVKTRMQVGSDVIVTKPSPPVAQEVCCRFYYMEMDSGVCRMYPAMECPSGFDARIPGVAAPQPSIKPVSTPFTGTLDGVVKIVRHEGIPQLWRGLSPTLVMSVPSTVIYYVGYENVRDYLIPSFRRRGMEDYAPLFAGATARTFAATIISPLELVRTRMQSGGADKSISRVVLGVAEMVKQNGPSSLWRGLAPTLWRDVPFSATYWAGYELLRHRLPRPNMSNEFVRDFWSSFIAGAISGTVAATITTPFDVAKTTRQVSRDTHVRADGKMLNLIRFIVERDGWKGLFRGLSPRIAKVAPACAIMISSYEMGKVFFTTGFAMKQASSPIRYNAT